MNIIKQKEILDKIQHEICRVHPIKKPRSSDKTCTSSVMKIYFTFGVTYDNKPITAIGFLDGNENQMSSTSPFYRLNEYINTEIVIQLISFLVEEFPYISDFSICSRSFSFDFQYPLEMENQEGISCDKIILDFRARDGECIQMLNNYLSKILSEFTDELSQTRTFQNRYNEYCNDLRKNIIDSSNDEEIEQIIRRLPIEIQRKLLESVPSQYFLQFYYDFQNQDDNHYQKKIAKINMNNNGE